MKCNLALIILREAINQMVGEGQSEISLAHFMHENRIPRTTFHNHLNSLIKDGFVSRVSRDKYKLHSKFVGRVIQVQYIKEREHRKNGAYENERIPF